MADAVIEAPSSISLISPRCSWKEIIPHISRQRKLRQNLLILLRGDGHFSTPEVHEWCESQEPKIFYILGQGGNKVLKEKSRIILQQAQLLYRLKQERYCRKKRQDNHKQLQSKYKGKGTWPESSGHHVIPEPIQVKLYTEFLYQAESWSKARRLICKVEVSEKGENLRFVVTNLQYCRKAYIYETIYCGRGQMEN